MQAVGLHDAVSDMLAVSFGCSLMRHWALLSVSFGCRFVTLLTLAQGHDVHESNTRLHVASECS